jgi:hypothetical protein
MQQRSYLFEAPPIMTLVDQFAEFGRPPTENGLMGCFGKAVKRPLVWDFAEKNGNGVNDRFRITGWDIPFTETTKQYGVVLSADGVVDEGRRKFKVLKKGRRLAEASRCYDERAGEFERSRQVPAE